MTLEDLFTMAWFDTDAMSTRANADGRQHERTDEHPRRKELWHSAMSTA